MHNETCARMHECVLVPHVLRAYAWAHVCLCSLALNHFLLITSARDYWSDTTSGIHRYDKGING